MKLIGYREANFRPDNGKGEEIKGCGRNRCRR